MSDSTNIGSISSQITSNYSSLAQLITAGSYVAGSAFAIASLAKFKGHKDNPTQVPIGTPFAMEAVAAALLFIPSITGG
jgi:intracellular multiplication protein IcmD